MDYRHSFVGFLRLASLAVILPFAWHEAHGDATHIDVLTHGSDAPEIHPTAGISRITFDSGTNSVNILAPGAVTPQGSWAASQIRSITFSNAPVSPVGVRQSEFSAVKLFPNPVVTSFRIDGLEPVDLQVLSTSGRVMLDIPEYKGELINASSLTPGIYIVKAGSFTSKIIRK